MQIVRELFDADPRILKDPAPGVWVNALSASTVDLVIRAWAHVSDLWEAQTGADARGQGTIRPGRNQHAVPPARDHGQAGGQSGAGAGQALSRFSGASLMTPRRECAKL
jgi:hypothetical protein